MLIVQGGASPEQREEAECARQDAEFPPRAAGAGGALVSCSKARWAHRRAQTPLQSIVRYWHCRPELARASCRRHRSHPTITRPQRTIGHASSSSSSSSCRPSRTRPQPPPESPTESLPPPPPPEQPRPWVCRSRSDALRQTARKWAARRAACSSARGTFLRDRCQTASRHVRHSRRLGFHCPAVRRARRSPLSLVLLLLPHSSAQLWACCAQHKRESLFFILRALPNRSSKREAGAARS